MTKRYLSIVTFCLLAVVPVRALLAGDGLYPEVPKAKARFSDTQECVEPLEDMRKNHMEYILHQRDATVHEGIRTRQHSLVECINCHVSDAADAARASSEKHFCSSCHSYASVKIDCFQCHADRPVKSSDNPSLAPSAMSHHIKHDHSAEVLTGKQLRALANGGANDE
ncbi:MAG: hypothetical protein ABFS22_05295 [Pseudomonadota bacterium]